MTTMAAVTAAASVMPPSATAATPSTTAATTTAARPAISISITITFPNRDALRSILPVEVRFVILFELCASFDRH
jgi:hypothetical protein